MACLKSLRLSLSIPELSLSLSLSLSDCALSPLAQWRSLSLSIYIYIYIYTNVYKRKYIYIHTYIHSYIYTCIMYTCSAFSVSFSPMPRYPNNVSDGHSGGALNLAIHVLILSCIEVCYIKLASIYIEDIHMYRERDIFMYIYIYIL